MIRTQAQQLADQKLTDAIENVLTAYFDNDDGGILGDYVIVAAISELDSDNEISNTTIVIPRDGTMAEYRIRGLLATGKASVDMAD